MYNNIVVNNIVVVQVPEYGYLFHIANVTLPDDTIVPVRSSPRSDYDSSLTALFEKLFELDDNSEPAPVEEIPEIDPAE